MVVVETLFNLFGGNSNDAHFSKFVGGHSGFADIVEAKMTLLLGIVIFVIGAMVGATFGIFLAALCGAARMADEGRE